MCRIFEDLSICEENVCFVNYYFMKKIWEVFEFYLYLFMMEYLLIVGGILYIMWSGMWDFDFDL